MEYELHEFPLQRFNESSAMQFCQFVPNFAFAFTQFLRHVDLDFNVKIAALPRDSRQSPFSQPKSLTALRPCRNFQAYLSFNRGYEQFAAQHCPPRFDLDLMNQIAAL